MLKPEPIQLLFITLHWTVSGTFPDVLLRKPPAIQLFASQQSISPMPGEMPVRLPK